ncbi:putative toxin-antitoxin system toxin component, PIN family [Fibrella aquatilis]|uniref:Toxin-antitoxin system toxin component, PIN family n=1 Tax=Fibrella aquatilis TaxID=2817059 RepID=A0A939JYS9_9BACT|nr:putative toxin-antitoxin system toxin component, PIN family [Fibrella aquatilis]MBO0932424.1 putative toxin-antitoxin system toxin component, PIN family [Fibrella aquatilis]
MRLILDTNVLVSATIQRSYPYFIVDRVLTDPELVICISEQLFAEYVDVLNREKFAKFMDFHSRAQTLLSDIETYGVKFTPTTKVDIIKDEPDNRLLELAETCGADYLITGNTNDFTIAEYKGTKIVSPKEFFEIVNLKL